MRLFNGNNEKDNKKTTPSVKDLSEDSRADIEMLLEDGCLPSDVAKDMGVPLSIVQSIRRMQIRTRQTKSPDEPKTREPKERTAAEEMQFMLMEQIRTATLEAQLNKIKDDNAYEKEKRDLDLKIKRLELKQKEQEIENQFGDDDEDDEIDPTKMVSEDGDVNIWGFLGELLKKTPRKTDETAPSVNPVSREQIEESQRKLAEQKPELDVTKPLTDEQIDFELNKATPEQLSQLKIAPKAMISKGLKQKYPGISKENIDKILSKIKSR